MSACAPGSVQTAIEVVIGGILGSRKSLSLFFSPSHCPSQTCWHMRGARSGLPSSATPPNLLALTPHFSLLLEFIFPLESIAWVNVCLGARCVFHSCREDKKGEERRGPE